MIYAENVKYMKKKIARILICVLIIICGWNVMVREWNQAGKTDSEYKENNANARAQSSNSQDVSLERRHPYNIVDQITDQKMRI
mgnify:CR=1 FL=1